MTKDSKTLSTIRRRKGKEVAVALQKLREENPKTPVPVMASEADVTAAEVEDHCYLFDDRAKDQQLDCIMSKLIAVTAYIAVLGPIVLRRLMSSEKSLFLALIVIRCANALLIQTAFVPDEYWQSLEVAHKMAFGYGYMTWEWKEGLRGFTYPLVFATLYKFLHIFGLDSRTMLIKGPMLLQALIAAFGDLHLYKLSSRISGRATAQWTLLCQLLNWFTMYCCTRTLTNSTETSLVVAALYYFPWPDSSCKRNDTYKFLALASMSVIVRPTAALVWVLLCCWHLQRMRGTKVFSGTVLVYAVVGFLSLGTSLVIDFIWYGEFTIVQLNFLWFNVVKGDSAIYGSHPAPWYFLQGFPIMLWTLIPPFLIGATMAKNKMLLWIILWILVTHSCLAHKEFRFVFPALPLAMHYCGVFFQTFCNKPALSKYKPTKKEHSCKDTKSETAEKETESKPNEESEMKQEVESESKVISEDDKDSTCKPLSEKGDAANMKMFKSVKDYKESIEVSKAKETKSQDKEELLLEEQNRDIPLSPHDQRDAAHMSNLRFARLFILGVALTQIPVALYFSLIHQRGTVMVPKYLHQAALNNPQMDVLFLMPCHSTPYYSHLHQNISMRFLTCEPNLKNNKKYVDEAETFFFKPKDWLHKQYGHGRLPWPSHIVYFNALHKDISSLLTQSGYKMCESLFHTHFPEGRVSSNIIISCRWSSKAM